MGGCGEKRGEKWGGQKRGRVGMDGVRGDMEGGGRDGFGGWGQG